MTVAAGLTRRAPAAIVAACVVAGLQLASAGAQAPTQARPADLVSPIAGEIRLRVQRGISGADHAIALLVDRSANGPGWDERYDLGTLAGTSPTIDTGVAVEVGDRLDVLAEVGGGFRGLVVSYSADRDTRPGETAPRVIDHWQQAERRLCGGGSEGPTDVTVLFAESAQLISLTCWEDSFDFDHNDFALAVDYTPETIPTETPTIAPTPTGTSSPTPTAEPEPATLFLPAASQRGCLRSRLPLDVALVIDASTSMLLDDGRGTVKMAAARSAAMAFLDQLALGRDRAAIVSFNDNASLDAPLTSERATLMEALGAIVNRQQTRIDLGVEVARLSLEPARPGAAVVMVVLTDGHANPVGAAEVLARVADARAAGIRVVTVGLGSDADIDLLRHMANSPADAFFSPDAASLERLYADLGAQLGCD